MNEPPIISRIYEVHETIDEFGRLGKCLGYFSDGEDARAVASGSGYYGSDASVREAFAMNFDGRCFLLAATEPIEIDANLPDLEKLRQSGIKKLSDKEKASLGLNK